MRDDIEFFRLLYLLRARDGLRKCGGPLTGRAVAPRRLVPTRYTATPYINREYDTASFVDTSHITPALCFEYDVESAASRRS